MPSLSSLPPASFDEAGFLSDPSSWSEPLAERIAIEDGLGSLTEPQLRLLRSLRLAFSRRGSPPPPPLACHLSGEELACASRLFPSPREAFRIAGLPDPGEEAKAYL